MGEQPIFANPSLASFCQLGVSNFLHEEAPSWHCRDGLLDSSLLDSGSLEWDVQLEQSSFGTLQSPNFQQCLHSFKAYNAITEDVRRVPRHTFLSNVGVFEASTSGWSVSYNAQQGEQGEDSSSSQLRNNGNDPMDTHHSYGGSSGDRDGSEDKNGSKEAMENDMATMDLTDDLLHLVFSFLDKKSLCFSAMVCRQWRVASAHEDFWKCLSFEGENVTEEKVGWLCCKFPKAVELTLIEVPCIDEVAREAMFSLQGLRNLNLHKGILTDSFFTALSSGCFALQQLSIMDAILATGGSQEVLVHHENLQQLHVIKCRVMRIAIRSLQGRGLLQRPAAPSQLYYPFKGPSSHIDICPFPASTHSRELLGPCHRGGEPRRGGEPGSYSGRALRWGAASQGAARAVSSR